MTDQVQYPVQLQVDMDGEGEYKKFRLFFDLEEHAFKLTVDDKNFDDLKFQANVVTSALEAIEGGQIYLNRKLVNPEKDGWMEISDFKSNVMGPLQEVDFHLVRCSSKQAVNSMLDILSRALDH